MGNYFSGSLDLFIDHTKISCSNLVKIARQFQNENLSFQFNFAWNDKYFESKGFDNIFNTTQIYDYDKALGCNEEGGLSEDSKQFEDFLISIDFPLDLLEHDYYINYRDWMDDSRSDQYLSDFMVEAIDNIKDKNEVFRCFYIEVYCNTKHYKDTNCEGSILGLINSLKEYRYLVGEAKDDNDIGYIKDEDWTYHRNFVWDESLLEMEYNRRRYICADCKLDKDMYDLCDNFKYCERAYNLCFQKYCTTGTIMEDE